MDDYRLDGKRAIVTGAARGIGREIAMCFARVGAVVLAVDRDATVLAEVGPLLAELSPGSGASQIDVTDSGVLDALVADAVGQWAGVDLLVNNAGVVDVMPFLELSEETWRRTFEVNVHAAFGLTQRVARIMRAQAIDDLTGCRGKVINISSGSAESGRPHSAAYGASKAALNHLSMSSAVALADDLIATTIIYPTHVAEGMWRELPSAFAEVRGQTPEQVIENRLRLVPTRRFQEASEVAATACFVATASPGMELNRCLIWSEAHVVRL